MHTGVAGARAANRDPMGLDAPLVVHDDGQEGMVDLEAAVVFDETELLELFMKKFTRDRVVPIISASVS